VIVSAADAVELDISTKRPATSPSDHGDCGTTGGNFCAGDKTIEELRKLLSEINDPTESSAENSFRTGSLSYCGKASSRSLDVENGRKGQFI
jgi:hypothetical protein